MGEVLAVLGPNGAGKSTLARALSGLVKPQAGQIIAFGEDITTASPHRISRSGITYIPEGRGVFPTLTVIENLGVAARILPQRRVKSDVLDQVFTLFPILKSRQAQRAGTLSGGEQQMLALARAFCTQSKLVIADELSLGLAPRIVEQVFSSLKVAKDAGIAMIVIEQFIARALKLADKCVILQRGTVVWSGQAEFASANVRSTYLGQSAGQNRSDVGDR
jgi:branched-chain amino acid transport system ATP-binding protein